MGVFVRRMWAMQISSPFFFTPKKTWGYKKEVSLINKSFGQDITYFEKDKDLKKYQCDFLPLFEKSIEGIDISNLSGIDINVHTKQKSKEKPFSTIMSQAFLPEHREKPLLITCQRGTQVIHLVGGVHITRINWMKMLPERVFAEADTFATEDYDTFANILLQSNPISLFLTAMSYGMELTSLDMLFSFEEELSKRWAPFSRPNMQIIGLEDRQKCLQHFKGITDYSETAFKNLVLDRFLAKEVMQYRNAQMCAKLLSMFENKQSQNIIAAVGKAHLPEMMQLLQNKGFEVVHQQVIGLECKAELPLEQLSR